ncbi:MAG: hypothetical protein ACYDCK_01110 [Thermoplasmatota archaeon]
MTWTKCDRCGGAFQAHFALAADAAVRWRGPSFDAAQAMGDIALAVAETLGVDARAPGAVEAFQRRVLVKPHRISDAAWNPREKFDPTKEREPWEFHVGWLAEAPDEAGLARAKTAALTALAHAKGFADAKPLS